MFQSLREQASLGPSWSSDVAPAVTSAPKLLSRYSLGPEVVEVVDQKALRMGVLCVPVHTHQGHSAVVFCGA
jgi:hypothetical protein